MEKQAKVRDYEKHPIPSSCRPSYGARIDQLVYDLYGLPPKAGRHPGGN